MNGKTWPDHFRVILTSFVGMYFTTNRHTG